MNLAGLILVAGGIFSICGAAFDWDWFINNYKAQFFVAILGRTGARIFYGVLGVILVVLGGLITVGILKDAKDARREAEQDCQVARMVSG